MNGTRSTFDIKFELKTEFVTGIYFHPIRPWILASLQNGYIQLWDYERRIILEKFNEHDGPVRGICFHNSHQMFVSGGDDYKIKIWNLQKKQSDSTLMGHSGIIRSTFFHCEYPWIISASDDKTARIWNWKSRECIAKLIEHYNNVMCAQFHPTDEVVFTASLDRYIRIWDISRLRKKHMPNDGEIEPIELFNWPDVFEKEKCDVHCSGVNWVEFNNSMSYFVSGSEDKKLVLSKYCDTKSTMLRTYIGHEYSVSSLVFHPNADLILSCSEDKSIRVWDIHTNTCVNVFRHKNERITVLAAHPTFNLFAGGTENGVIVFKYQIEKPAYCEIYNAMFFIKGEELRRIHKWTGEVSTLCKLSCHEASTQSYYKQLSANAYEDCFFLRKRSNNSGMFDIYLYKIKRNDAGNTIYERIRIEGISVCWTSEFKFAVLDKDRNVTIRNTSNEVVCKLDNINSGIDEIFYGGSEKVLLKNGDEFQMYDIKKRIVEASIEVSNVRYVIGDEVNYIALLSGNIITLVTMNLKILYIYQDLDRVMSGSWGFLSTFFYTTRNHIKYLRTCGNCGIIKTLKCPLYIMGASKSIVHCLDVKSNNFEVPIDSSFFMITSGLQTCAIAGAVSLLEKLKFDVPSLIALVAANGFPETAIHVAKDEKTRFGIALEYGKLEIALKSAEKLNDARAWEVLGETALLRGNLRIVEICYEQNNNFEKLSFLYFVTGNMEKLMKMKRNAEKRNDTNARFQITLLIGDIEERIKILRECGQITLAYLTAATHGYIDEADELKNEHESRRLPLPLIEKSILLAPPPPVCLLEENWPNIDCSEEN